METIFKIDKRDTITMDQFFNPQSIVVFGASANPKKGGNQVVRNMMRYRDGNEGVRLYIVHPKREKIEGVACFPSLDALMETIEKPLDLVLIVLPIYAVLETIKSCIHHKVRGIVVESGELTDERDKEKAKAIKEELRTILRNSKTRLTGPNALGYYNPGLHLSTSLGLTQEFLVPRERNVSFCGQSGLFTTGFIYRFQKNQPFGLAKSCAIGNKFDINECDVLDYYLHDPDTHVIGMYLEDIRDGKRFAKILGNNPEEKPIVLLKAGKTDKAKEAIVSHTGSLAGDYKVFEGLAKQKNVILVDNYSELFDCVSILASMPAPVLKSNKIGVISISGSGCVLGSDYAEKYGLELPEVSSHLKDRLSEVFPNWAPIHNPIDTWVSIEQVGDVYSFNHILGRYLESEEFDAIIMATIASSFARFDFNFISTMQKKYPNIPIILHQFGGYLYDSFIEKASERGIPILQNFESIFKLLSKIWDASKKRR